jgi:hypothetical protein
MQYSNALTSAVRVINPDDIDFPGGLALFTTSDAEVTLPIQYSHLLKRTLERSLQLDTNGVLHAVDILNLREVCMAPLIASLSAIIVC